jgi:DNA-binding response OmpR family regulator
MAKTALIVDDNRALAEDLAEILEAEGYCIRIFDDPELVLREEPDLHFDVALLDVRMPGIDGVTLQRMLMQKHPEARFVLMTAYADDQRIAQGLAAGACALLTKPVPLDRLFSVLGEKGSRELLLIEDDPSFREALREALAQSGYHCLAASSAQEARQLLAAAEHKPAVAVIDVRLPDENGARLANELSRELLLPCVLITGLDPEEPARLAGDGTMVIVKPFSPETLLRALLELRRAHA